MTPLETLPPPPAPAWPVLSMMDRRGVGVEVRNGLPQHRE